MADTPFGPVDSDVSPALLPLATQQSVTVSNTVSGTSGWTTGDYKMSAQAADHADAGGSGQWLICDASAIDAAYVALIALVGATRPDARGRTLVMKGTNASVSTLLANDGQAVANRRPHHRTTLTDPGHVHHERTEAGGGGSVGTFYSQRTDGASGDFQTQNDTTSATTGITAGSGVGTDALDTPSFIVPGSLFIHT